MGTGSGTGGEAKSKGKEDKSEKIICGLVMPISEIEGLGTDHWLNVRKSIERSINDKEENIEVQPVFESEDAGLIHSRIVDNLFKNDIVICDVSCRNPNVMFELGMRLAFDKPVVIVSDDQTNIAFDSGPIEHIKYPRSLSFFAMEKFMDELKSKVHGTLRKIKEGSYKSFLSSFGSYSPGKIESKQVTEGEFINLQLDKILKILNKRSYSENQGSGYLVEALASLQNNQLAAKNGKLASHLRAWLMMQDRKLIHLDSSKDLVNEFLRAYASMGMQLPNEIEVDVLINIVNAYKFEISKTNL